MLDDIECPYCEHGQEICHDDGYGYVEDEIFEQECCNCEKIFVFTTAISFLYEAEKAPCLNGAKHDYKMTHTIPREFARLRCTVCGDELPCKAEAARYS